METRIFLSLKEGKAKPSMNRMLQKDSATTAATCETYQQYSS